MTNTLIAIDPGPAHTAVILIDQIDYAATDFHIAAKSVLTFPQRSRLLAVFDKYRTELDAIILEDFKLQPDKASAQSYSRFETVKIIERITCQLETLGLTHLLVMQQPGMRLTAKAFPDYHRQQLYANIDRKEQPHLYSAYQHARFFISDAAYRKEVPLQCVTCQSCGWSSNTRMRECFNCTTKLPRKVVLDK